MCIFLGGVCLVNLWVLCGVCVSLNLSVPFVFWDEFKSVLCWVCIILKWRVCVECVLCIWEECEGVLCRVCVSLKWSVFFMWRVCCVCYFKVECVFLVWSVCLVYLWVLCRVCVSLKWSVYSVFVRSLNEFYVECVLF